MKSQKKSPARKPSLDLVILTCAVLFLALFAVTEAENLMLQGGIRNSSVFRVLLLTVICGLFYIGTYLRIQKTQDRRALDRLMILFFILYLYLLVNLTLLDRSLGRGSHTAHLSGSEKRAYYMELYVNFRPLKSIWEVYIKGFVNGYVNSYYMLLNLLGNICAFMPFAFFLPRFFKAQSKWYVFLPTMFLTVALIEGLQLLFMAGSCDVDDLILNVGGAFLMFWILKIPIFKKLTAKFL